MPKGKPAAHVHGAVDVDRALLWVGTLAIAWLPRDLLLAFDRRKQLPPQPIRGSYHSTDDMQVNVRIQLH